MNKRFVYILSLLMLLTVSCNQGLAPGGEPITGTGFGGTIVFKGDWPENVKHTYLVLFRNLLEDSTDFSASNLVFLSEEIPSGTTEFHYSTLENMLDPQTFAIILPGEYSYLAVAQSESETIRLVRSAWKVAGVYYNGNDISEPGQITVDENVFLNNINITVDFNSPPPQPPQKFPAEDIK